MSGLHAAFVLAVVLGCAATATTPPDAAGTAPAAASLADLPARWADRLVPIPPQRLDELDPAKAARIRETRARLDALLDSRDVAKDELANAFGRLGALYAAHRMYAGAERALHDARVLDPQAFRWVYYAAHVALEQGNAQQALAALDDAARLDPEYPALALRRGEALLGLNRLDEARTAYRQVEAQAGLRAAALYGLGQIDLLQRDWQGAADKLGEVLALQPQADAVNYPYGKALVGLGRRDAAREYLVLRGEVKPDYDDPLIVELRSLQAGARYRFEQGVIAVRRRDFVTAADDFGAGLADEPDNVRARTSYARALWLAGRHTAAEQALRRAVADGPTATLPRFLLAVVNDHAGDTDAAAEGYRGVLQIDPGHQGALSYLADLEWRRGDAAAAAALYQDAIDAGMREARLYLYFWGALRALGTDDGILRGRLETFDREFPEPPVFRYLLARLLATSTTPGVADRSRALVIARALQVADPAPQYSELLALCLAASGDFGAARQMQQDLVELAGMRGAWLQVAALQSVADAYRDGQLPDMQQAAHVPLFMPPPVDADAALLNYPAGRPY
ncbi:MAG: tetratricopeptide repeat protein [Gammaproteobacteria bacterium]|nr:tetratricopeptide repeat protein [Gammaproteobacteria bacterium]